MTLVVHLTGHERALTVDARVVRCCVCALESDGGVRYRGALAFCGEVL